MQSRYEPQGSLTVISPQGGSRRDASATLDLVSEIEGQQNKGFYYGVLLEHAQRPAQVARGVVAAKGFAVRHRTANHYVVTVIAGTGTIRIHREGGPEDCVVARGDIAVLPPDTLHEWIGGSDTLEFVGVELLPDR